MVLSLPLRYSPDTAPVSYTHLYVVDDTTGIPTGFKCAYCPDNLQSDLLEQIADLYSEEPANTRVFSGNYVPRFEESKEYMAIDFSKPFALLGEPIMIGTDLKVAFSNRKRTNLLMVGSNDDTMTPVSYTHLDVYKRQVDTNCANNVHK